MSCVLPGPRLNRLASYYSKTLANGGEVVRPAPWQRRESDSKCQAVLTSVAPWVFSLQGQRAQAIGPHSWDHPSPAAVEQLGTEEILFQQIWDYLPSSDPSPYHFFTFQCLVPLFPVKEAKPAESREELGAASLEEGTSASERVPSSALLALSWLPLMAAGRGNGGHGESPGGMVF